MRDHLRPGLRILAVVGKELVETIRRPWSVLSIVLGPFVILAIFGLGYIGQPSIRAALVIPPESGLPADLATYRAAAGDALQIVAVDPERVTAGARLAAQEVDVVVTAPADAQATLERGQQVVIQVDYDSIDPYVQLLVTNAADRIAGAVNREVIRIGATEAADAATDAGAPLPARFDPSLVASPTRAEVRALAPTQPSITWFYGIGLLVLIVQHMTVTLGALSIFRDRRRGLVELFRLAPIRSGEALLGKYIAIGLVSGIVAASLIALLVGVFQLPVLGQPASIGAAIALLILCGTGLGLMVGLISDSERQVVQLTLLVLLTSVFFGGLAVNLALFSEPVQRGAELLPVTQATRIFHDVLLRGEQGDLLRFALLGAMALALFLGSVVLLRRTLAPKR